MDTTIYFMDYIDGDIYTLKIISTIFKIILLSLYLICSTAYREKKVDLFGVINLNMEDLVQYLKIYLKLLIIRPCV